jgi:hypothetical protein
LKEEFAPSRLRGNFKSRGAGDAEEEDHYPRIFTDFHGKRQKFITLMFPVLWLSLSKIGRLF